MKKKLVALAIILIIIIAGLIYTNRPKNLNELTIYGNIEIRQVDLSFQVAGQIKEMLVEEGDSVRKGQLIATLDDKDYKAEFQKAQAQVLQTNAAMQSAEDVFKRKTPLCSDDTISKTECETITHNRDESIAANESAKATQNFAQNQLLYTKLYAPDDGIVMVRVQEPGATVQKSQIVYTIAKNKPVWIRTYISEKDLGNVHYGMKAKVLTDSVDPKTGKKKEYIGRIGYISPTAEFTPKTVQTEDLRTDLVYRVRVYIDDVDKFLRQGMPTTVKIDLTEISEKNNG